MSIIWILLRLFVPSVVCPIFFLIRIFVPLPGETIGVVACIAFPLGAMLELVGSSMGARLLACTCSMLLVALYVFLGAASWFFISIGVAIGTFIFFINASLVAAMREEREGIHLWWFAPLCAELLLSAGVALFFVWQLLHHSWAGVALLFVAVLQIIARESRPRVVKAGCTHEGWNRAAHDRCPLCGGEK